MLLLLLLLKIKVTVFTGPILAISRELRPSPRQTLAIAGLLEAHYFTSWELVTMPIATRVTGRSHSLSMDSARLMPGRALASVPFLSHKPCLVPCPVQWDPLTDIRPSGHQDFPGVWAPCWAHNKEPGLDRLGTQVLTCHLVSQLTLHSHTKDSDKLLT